MGTIRTRVLVSLASTLFACGLGGWWLARRGTDAPLRLVDRSPEADALLLDRRGAASGAPGSLVREPISAEDASKMWPIDPALHVYDPQVYYRYKGGLDLDRGTYHIRTSLDGYREDFERLPAKRDFLAVVTGDSHTDGVCDNRESFANRLEARLSERHAGKAVEVLNTGVSGYSFYQYLGSLERHLALSPDAFVVAFYGGNDFLDVVRPWHYFHHTVPPPRSNEYWKKLSSAQGISPALVGNAFNQLLYFQYNPDQMDVALKAAEEVSAEIVRVCREHGIAPFFVYIPPGIGAAAGRSPEFAKMMAALELSEGEYAQFDRLADALIGKLNDSGAEVIDLREAFGPDLGAYYLSDLHIDPKAHERIAELLLPRVEAAWLARSAAK
jgi:lysophospholipase L1-like esterase